MQLILQVLVLHTLRQLLSVHMMQRRMQQWSMQLYLDVLLASQYLKMLL